MNYFELYPGDYLRDTTRLTLVEHGAYLRLLMAYYAEEQPLPASHDELFVITGALKPADKDAVRKVADRFFPIGPDGQRHNSRADEEIAKAQGRMEGGEEKSNNAAERQRRHRERRQNLFDVLRAVGITLPFNTSTADLEAKVMDLAERNASRNDVTWPVTPVTRHVTPSPTATRPQTPDPSLKATAGTTHTTAQPTEAAVGVGTPAGLAAAAMNRAGCRITSQNPNLIAACAEGVTTEHLLELVRQFPEKPAGYVIAAARREHAESAKPNGASNGTREPRESLVDRNARRAAEIFERTGTE